MRLVYRSHGRLVYAVAYKVLGDRSLAEEAVQQTFVKAWRAAQSFDESRELGPWLAAIARRVAIDLYRREAVRTADPIEFAPPGDPALVAAPHSAEAVYDVWEVRQAVAQLPSDEQEVVRLQHLDGYHPYADRRAARCGGRHREVEVVPSPQASGHAPGTPARMNRIPVIYRMEQKEEQQ